MHPDTRFDPPPRPEDSGSFFRWLRGLNIRRGHEGWVGGVASGLAVRTGLDVTLVRGIFVVLSIVTGVGVLLYGLCWALLPDEQGRIHTEEALRGRWSTGMTGALIATLIGLSLQPLASGWTFRPWGPTWGFLWLALIGLVVFAIFSSRERSRAARAAQTPPHAQPGAYAPPGPAGTPPAPGAPAMPAASAEPSPFPASPTASFSAAAPGGPRPGAGSGSGPTSDYGYGSPSDYGYGSASGYGSGYGAPPAHAPAPAPLPPRPMRRGPGAGVTVTVMGAALLVSGLVVGLDVAGVFHLGSSLAAVSIASGVGVLALALIVLGAMGRRGGALGVFSIFGVAATVAFGALTGIGSVNWTVATNDTALGAGSSRASLESGINVVAARGTLDLRDLTPADTVGGLTIPVTSIAATVTVFLPDWATVSIDSSLAAGRMELEDDNGTVASSSGIWSPRNHTLGPGPGTTPDITLEIRGSASVVRVIHDGDDYDDRNDVDETEGTDNEF